MIWGEVDAALVNAMIEAWLLGRGVPYAPGANPSMINGGS